MEELKQDKLELQSKIKQLLVDFVTKHGACDITLHPEVRSNTLTNGELKVVDVKLNMFVRI